VGLLINASHCLAQAQKPSGPKAITNKQPDGLWGPLHGGPLSEEKVRTREVSEDEVLE
jgi:hypothetical protein